MHIKKHLDLKMSNRYSFILEILFVNEYCNEMLYGFVQIAVKFGEEFTSHIVNYLNRVISQTQHDVGKCWPISLVYNATVVTGCNKILDPYVRCLFHM